MKYGHNVRSREKKYTLNHILTANYQLVGSNAALTYVASGVQLMKGKAELKARMYTNRSVRGPGGTEPCVPYI